MGEILTKYYAFAKENAGIEGAMRLAMKTKISGAKAAGEPDSPENLKVFRDAVKEITGKDAGF